MQLTVYLTSNKGLMPCMSEFDPLSADAHVSQPPVFIKAISVFLTGQILVLIFPSFVCSFYIMPSSVCMEEKIQFRQGQKVQIFVINAVIESRMSSEQ